MDKETILKIMTRHLEEMLPDVNTNTIDDTSILNRLGAGSIERAILIERMREELNLQTDRFEFHKANNIGELAKLLLKMYQREKQS